MRVATTTLTKANETRRKMLEDIKQAIVGLDLTLPRSLFATVMRLATIVRIPDQIIAAVTPLIEFRSLHFAVPPDVTSAVVAPISDRQFSAPHQQNRVI